MRQKVGISFFVTEAGRLSVLVLDRDGYSVRLLASNQPVRAGNIAFEWDGKDEAGQVVADEAYSLKIDLRTPAGTTSYFPAADDLEQTDAKTTSYDRQQGILSYQLAAPSRVHLQAGSSRMDPKTKQWMGPCLKTIVNREPRIGGSVIEHWDGYDESGTIYVPDLPNFALSVYASALPENALMTTGNRKESFLEQASRRSGPSMLVASTRKGEHHEGLSSYEDTAPRLKIHSRQALSDSKQTVDLAIALEGPSARTFEREPGEVMVFLGDDLLQVVDPRPAPMTLRVEIPGGGEQTRRLTVNWVSAYGPVAANSIALKPDGADDHASNKTAARQAPASQSGGQP